jgi:uncharacterized protein YggU (UPF0235/DUF167 family)
MYIKVIAHTNSKKEKIEEKKKDCFEIWVKEKSERNMANSRIIKVLAGYFKISSAKIRIINGHKRPNKLLAIDEK